MKKNIENQSNGEVTLKGIDAAIASIHETRAKMTFLTPLTPKERDSLPRITSAKVALMESAVLGAQENEALVPASIEVAKFAADVEMVKSLRALVLDLRDLSADVH